MVMCHALCQTYVTVVQMRWPTAWTTNNMPTLCYNFLKVGLAHMPMLNFK